jgi:hypothetical protein
MGIQINGQTDTISAVDGSITVATDLTVPGALTYDDVTNIDSVGVVTARAGINVTGGNLTVDAFSNTANNYLSLRNGYVPSSSGGMGFMSADHSGANADGIAIYGHDGISLYTAQTERLRITSAGLVGIGTNVPENGLHVSDGSSFAAPQNAGAGRIMIEHGSSADLQFMTANSGYNHIFFGDQDDANAGVIYYQHNSNVNAMVFSTNGGERLRIDSSGRLLLGTGGSTSITCTALFQGRSDGATNSANLRLAKGSSTPGTTDSLGIISFSDSGSQPAAQIQVSRDSGTWSSGSRTPGALLFMTAPDSASAASERLRITSTGKCEVYKGTSTTGKTSGSEAFTVGNGAGNHRFAVYPDGSTVIGGQGLIGNYNILLQNDGHSYFGSRMKIGTTTEGEANADDLTVATSGHTGMTIRSGTANRGNIYFSDGTSGDAEYRGYITYDHDGDRFKFGTANADRLVITSDGNICIGGHSSNYANSPLEVRGTNAGGDVAIRVTNNSTTAGTQAGIIFTTTTADYTTAGIAFERGGTADALRFYVGQSAGGGGFTNATERLRITSGGDLLLGGQTAYTYDDTGASNTILDITNSTNNKRGILSLSGNSNANGPSIGTIWFNNDQNSGTGPGATMKLAAAIQAKAVTSDSNAGDDSGAYLQFLTKPESAALAESMVIHSDGEVTKVKQPGFFARRSVAGDGRAAGAQEWSVSGTGTFNTGSHFNTSNGRFTAPIAGRYLFTAAPGYKQTGQNFQFYFRINGGDASESVRFIDGGDDLTSHSTAAGSVIYNLSANDYVDVYVGVTHHTNVTTNYFMGYLLG